MALFFLLIGISIWLSEILLPAPLGNRFVFVGPILLSDKRVDGMGPMETPQWRGAIAGGIWQPVKMIATGDV